MKKFKEFLSEIRQRKPKRFKLSDNQNKKFQDLSKKVKKITKRPLVIKGDEYNDKVLNVCIGFSWNDDEADAVYKVIAKHFGGYKPGQNGLKYGKYTIEISGDVSGHGIYTLNSF